MPRSVSVCSVQCVRQCWGIPQSMAQYKDIGGGLSLLPFFLSSWESVMSGEKVGLLFEEWWGRRGLSVQEIIIDQVFILFS